MTVAENICSLADPYARSFLLYDVNEMQLSLIYIVAVERKGSDARVHVFKLFLFSVQMKTIFMMVCEEMNKCRILKE